MCFQGHLKNHRVAYFVLGIQTFRHGIRPRLHARIALFRLSCAQGKGNPAARARCQRVHSPTCVRAPDAGALQ